MGLFTQVYQDTIVNNKKKVISLHFFISAALGFIVALICYFLDNREWKWAVFSPGVIFIFQQLWYLSRKFLLTHDKERYYNCTFFLFFGILFIMGYMMIFAEVLTPNYEEASKCEYITSKTSNSTHAENSEQYSIIGVKFQDKHGDMIYGCACASTTYRKNILFKEPYPNTYYHKGDEVGAKDTPYSFSQVKLPSWKCTGTIDEVKSETSCHYRFLYDKKKALGHIDNVIKSVQDVTDQNTINSQILNYCINQREFAEVLYLNPPGYYSPVLFCCLLLFYCAAFAWGMNEWIIGISYHLVEIFSNQISEIKKEIKEFHIFGKHKKHKKKKNKKNKKKRKDKKKMKVVCCWKKGKQQIQPDQPIPALQEMKSPRKKKVNELEYKLETEHLGDKQKQKKLKLQQVKKYKTELKHIEDNSPKSKKLLSQQGSPILKGDDFDEVKGDKNNKRFGGGFNSAIQSSQFQTPQTEEVDTPKMTNQAKINSSNFKLPPILSSSKKSSHHKKKKSILEEDDYDLDKTPGNIGDAVNHQQAWIVGQEYGLDSKNPGQFCQCCSRQMQRRQLESNCNLKDLSFLGSGYPQYFYFIRFSLYLLLVIFMTSGIYSLVTNLEGGDCVDPSDYGENDDISHLCHQNPITIPSLGNKKGNNEKLDGQYIVNFVAILGVCIGLQIFRKQQRQVEVDCDANDTNASDYTIYVTNIPYQFDAEDYDEELKRFIEVSVTKLAYKGAVGKKFQISSMSLCYDTQEQFKMQSEKKELLARKQEEIKYYMENDNTWKNGEDEFEKLSQEIDHIDYKLRKLEELYKDGRDRHIKALFAGHAFISFTTEQQKEEILKFFGEESSGLFSCCSRKKRRLKFRKQQLKLFQAQDPTNVFWEWLHVRPKQRKQRRTIGLIITVLALVFCLGLIIFLKFIQSQFTNSTENPTSNDKIIAQVFAIGISLSILLLNGFLTFIIRGTALREAYPTRTEYNIKVAKSITIAQFCNTGLLSFLSDVVMRAMNSGDDEFALIFRTGGLVYNIFYVFLSNAMIGPLMALFDPPVLIKKFQRYKIQKKLARLESHYLSQRQLNELYENPLPDMATQYAILLKTMYFTAFYSVIIPLGMVISMIGLLLTYYVDKKNILRNRTIRYTISTSLCVEMTEMVEYILPIYAGANWIFFYYVTGDRFQWACVLGFALSVVNAALPMEKINTALFSIEEAGLETQTYEEAVLDFDTDYQRENPATKTLCRDEFYEKMSKLKRKRNKSNK